MFDYLCDMLQCDICSYGLDGDCDKCPFNVITEGTSDPIKYLETIKQRIEIAISMLEEGF